MVARMANGTVGHWYYSGGAWAYDNLGGTVIGDPEITSDHSGGLSVFVEATDENLWQKWWTGTAWTGWQNVSELAGSGKIASGPGAHSWVIRQVRRLYPDAEQQSRPLLVRRVVALRQPRRHRRRRS